MRATFCEAAAEIEKGRASVLLIDPTAGDSAFAAKNTVGGTFQKKSLVHSDCDGTVAVA